LTRKDPLFPFSFWLVFEEDAARTITSKLKAANVSGLAPSGPELMIQINLELVLANGQWWSST
jgi:hypothetical protein